jgi:hypothetical protein
MTVWRDIVFVCCELFVGFAIASLLLLVAFGLWSVLIHTGRQVTDAVRDTLNPPPPTVTSLPDRRSSNVRVIR